MNAERLRFLVKQLLAKEQQHAIQQHLTTFSQNLQSYVAEPQNQQRQLAFAEALEKLDKQVATLVAEFDPATIKMLNEIKATPFFGVEMISKIRAAMTENQMAPAVVLKALQKLIQRREAYIKTLQALDASLAAVGIEPDELKEGEAEIGFLLPRSLFQNRLDGLISELRIINRILRALSEAITGTAAPIEVRQISTSDPFFFFGLDPATLVSIGGVITWALHTWKQVESIRKLRSEAQRNGIFVEEEIKTIFDGKIDRVIREAINKKVDELLADKIDEARKHEQKTDLEWALESIFARIERGMIVELRFLPPKVPAQATAEDQKRSETFSKLSDISSQLVFPPAEESPLLALRPPPVDPSSVPV